MEILAVKNLTKKFGGIRAVNDLSLSIKKGKITGIVGPNGSGKTTLINVLSGLLPIDGGVIEIGETRLVKIRPYDIPSYGITRTFQQVRLFDQMTALDNILLAIGERNIFSSIFERHNEFHLKQAKEVLGRVGLSEKRNELAGNLSYGQRKLLEIGRAIAANAEIFLLDEPFSGLFPEMIKIVEGVIKEFREKEKTVVLIEHDMGIIRELCDYVFVLDSGELLADGKPGEVLSRPEVIEAYLGE